MKRLLLVSALLVAFGGLRVVPCQGASLHSCCPAFGAASLSSLHLSCCSEETAPLVTAVSKSLDFKANDFVVVASLNITISTARQFSFIPNVHWGGVSKSPSYLTKSALLL